MREICIEGGVFLFNIKSLGGVYNTQTKLNPGAALEEPEQQGIRSIKLQQHQRHEPLQHGKKCACGDSGHIYVSRFAVCSSLTCFKFPFKRLSHHVKLSLLECRVLTMFYH